MSHDQLILWGLLTLAPAAYFVFDGDYVMAIALSVVAFSGWFGYRTGLLGAIGSVAMFMAAYAWAGTAGRLIEPQVSEYLGTTGMTNRFTAIAIAGLGISFLVSLVVWLIHRRLSGRGGPAERFNRVGGFTFGVAQAAAVVLIILGAALVLSPRGADPVPQDGSTVLKWVSVTADQTRGSRIAKVADRYNPFKRFPELNRFEEIQQTTRVLTNPAALAGLTDQPAIRELRSDPAVAAALNELREDAQIGPVIRGAEPLDRAGVRRILDHPATLRLADDPKFIDKLREAIRQASDQFGGGHASPISI